MIAYVQLRSRRGCRNETRPGLKMEAVRGVRASVAESGRWQLGSSAFADLVLWTGIADLLPPSGRKDSSGLPWRVDLGLFLLVLSFCELHAFSILRFCPHSVGRCCLIEWNDAPEQIERSG